MSTQSSFFNHFKLISITLYDIYGNNTLDITTSFVSLVINESIYTDCISATLVLQDTQNLDTTFPILGGEIIDFKMQDKEDSLLDNESILTLSLQVNSILANQNEEITSRTQQKTLTLELKSQYYFISKLKKISRHFKDSLLNVLNYLFLNIMKMDASNFILYRENIDVDFISNFWNVSEIMNYLSFKGIDTFYFETLKNKIFASLSLLSKQRTEELWSMSTFDMEDSYNSNKVLSCKFNNKFSIEEVFAFDGFGNTIYNPKLLNYNFEILNNNIKKEMYNYNELGNTNFFWNFFNDKGEYTSIKESFTDSEVLNRRNIIIQNMSNYNVVCNLKGSFSRNVGDIIEFDMPSIQNIPSDISNKLFKGKWLITDIVHTMDNKARFDQSITIIKTGFQQN